jgi:hypothetical protein
MTLQSEPKFIFTDSKAAPWLDSKVARGVQVKNLVRQPVLIGLGAPFPVTAACALLMAPSPE